MILFRSSGWADRRKNQKQSADENRTEPNPQHPKRPLGGGNTKPLQDKSRRLKGSIQNYGSLNRPAPKHRYCGSKATFTTPGFVA